MKHGNLLLLFSIIMCINIQAQDTDSIAFTLQPIIITAYRTPMSALYVNRSISVIDGKTIRQAGTITVEDALRNGSNISVQSRGLFGVQTDIGIRGALFSQNLILLNGIPINDPQTAHHNFDIPVPTLQMDRIEVLKGPGSAQYGANAFGGVINIITQRPQEPSGSIRLSGGEHGFFEGIGSLNITPSFMRSSNSLEIRRSDGYRYDTDFHMMNFTTNTDFDLPFGNYSFLGGYTKKTFGAFDFYSPGRNKPSKEWTETTLLNLSTSFEYPSVQVVPRIFFRKHYDKFMYDIRIPDRYINVHTTQVSGGEIMGRFIASENFTFVTGLETNFNTIASSSLGNHQQSLIAMYASLHYRTGDCIALDIGMRSDFHSDYGVQVNPTAGLGYNFSSSGKIFATIGRSYRAPSYTELYYSDPSTAGNPKLHPEEGWSYETGIDYILGINWHWSASLFERDQTNLIDYVRYLSSDTQSVAVNFTSAKTQGFDIDLRWQKIQFTSEIINESGISLQQFIFSYCYLNSQIERGAVYSSRYAFTHPRHRISAGISIIFPYAVEFSLDAVHNIKLNNDSYTLLNMRAAKHFTSAIIFIRGTNLLDKSYEEIIGIPMPGRWLWAGIEFKVF